MNLLLSLHQLLIYCFFFQLYFGQLQQPSIIHVVVVIVSVYLVVAQEYLLLLDSQNWLLRPATFREEDAFLLAQNCILRVDVC